MGFADAVARFFELSDRGSDKYQYREISQVSYSVFSASAAGRNAIPVTDQLYFSIAI